MYTKDLVKSRVRDLAEQRLRGRVYHFDADDLISRDSFGKNGCLALYGTSRRLGLLLSVQPTSV